VGMNPVLDGDIGSERVWKWGLLPGALAALLFSFVYRGPWFRETIRYTVQGIALTPVFVTAIRYSKWWPFRVLNARPVAFVGVLSYTLYLSHQAAIAAFDYWMPDRNPWIVSLCALGIALGVAAAIHGLIEKPCARMRKRFTRDAPARPWAAALLR
jgi:peptidoglycan/LPS O-acetylase OafA/YrhL